MQLMRRVQLGDQQLDELDNRIIITGVEEEAARLNYSAVSRFGASGQRVTSMHRDTLDVTVKFALKIKKNDLVARSELFEKVAGWAMEGGWLALNYRPNRRLRVVCVTLPAAGDQVAWETEYEITFRAYNVPYWQQASPVSLTVNSTKSMSRSMEIPGTAQSVLNLEFENISGMEINTLTVGTDESSFSFKSLGLKAGETLVINHTAEGLLRIRIRTAAGSTRSALAKRTEDSADDLTVSPGTATVTLTAQRAGKVTLSCYGRYV